MIAAIPVVCPKCGYARKSTDTAPDWQCPACGIAYNKFRPHIERARQLVTPPRTGDTAPAWTADGSVWSLVAANMLALGVSCYQDWSTVSLMMLNRDLDRQGTPNIGTLMFTPYIRIVPMHITIILGGE